MAQPPRYGVKIPLAVDIKSNGETTGCWEGYALSNEFSHDLQCVVLNDMTVVTRNHPDPDIASAAKHLIPEANRMENIQRLRDEWEDDYAGRHGEGAKADHIYERNQAYQE